MDMQAIKTHVEALLPEKRYQHTVRVTETALKLASLYGESAEKTECAAMLHDVAKFFEKDKMEQMIKSDPEIPDRFLNFHPSLWHAPVGAHYVKEVFHLTDPDILNAITYHTTGRCGMSLLEKIIFIADYVEPGRSFPGVEEVRDVVEKDLDKAMALALRNTIQFLVSRSSQVYPDTIDAYNAFISFIGG